MMRRLTSSPKPASRVARMTSSALGSLDALGQHPQAVAHRVEAGEVGGRLARQDQVVRRERVHEVRAGHLDDLGAGLDEQLDGLVEALLDAGLVALAAELGDDADPQPGQVAGGAGARRLDDRRAPAGRCWWSRAGRGPPMTSCSSAASSTVRVTGPAWSRELASATSP